MFRANSSLAALKRAVRASGADRKEAESEANDRIAAVAGEAGAL